MPVVTGGRTLAAGAAWVAAACDTRGRTVLPNVRFRFELTKQKIYSHLGRGGNADPRTGPVTGAGTLSCAAGTFGAILADHTQTRPSHTVRAPATRWEGHTRLTQYVSRKPAMLRVAPKPRTCPVRHRTQDYRSRGSLTLALSLRGLGCERPRSCLCHHDGITLLLLLVVCIGQDDLVGGQVALVVVGRRGRRSTARCCRRAGRS